MKNSLINTALPLLLFFISHLLCPDAYATTQDPSVIKIIGQDVPESGVLSAYLQHKFTIEKGNLSISEPEWTLTVPLENGDNEIIRLTDQNFSCITDVFDYSSNYRTDANGIMHAKLQFSCKLNDNQSTASSHDLLFDLKPYIEYAMIEEIESESPSSSYNAYYKVKYLGADKLKVSVEEEFGGNLKVSYLYEPYIAYGCAEHIKAAYKAWIDFEAINNYGKDLCTIELLPYGDVARVDNINNTSGSDAVYKAIEVYDAQGKKIAVIDNLPDVFQLQVKGLLIIRAYKSSGETKTFKILV